MIAVCPACWQLVPPAAECCPASGAGFKTLREREYVEKLTGALGHPDRETVMRVAGILGARREERALPALIAALRRYWSEPYVAAAIVRALGRLPQTAARTAVREALGHESLIVCAKTALALQADASDVPHLAPDSGERKG